MKKKLVIEIEFDEVQDYEDEPTYLEVSKVSLGDDSNLTETERAGIAEGWAQSDLYSIGLTHAFLQTIDSGNPIDANNIYYY